MVFKALSYLDLDEKREDTAYGWYRAYQKFGCPAASYASDFKEYSEIIDREFAETLANRLLVSINDNIRELQK